jgi:hypothetical protein
VASRARPQGALAIEDRTRRGSMTYCSEGTTQPSVNVPRLRPAVRLVRPHLAAARLVGVGYGCQESDRDNGSRAASRRANGFGGRHRSSTNLWSRRGDKSSQPAVAARFVLRIFRIMACLTWFWRNDGRWPGLTSVIMMPAWVHRSRSGIGSASAARQGGAWKGSAKYWVSCVTRSSVNSMTLTAYVGTPS